MFQLAEFCRICLSKTSELVSLKSQDEDNLRIIEKLTFINPDLIPLDDEFPEWVCISCKTQINGAFHLLEKARESYSVLNKLISRVKTVGPINTSDIDGDIKDLLKTIPEINSEVKIESEDIKTKTELNNSSTTNPDTNKPTLLKVRSISSINALVHSSPVPEESILGDLNQDVDETSTPNQQNVVKKTPVTVLFNPKNGRIIPIKQTSIVKQIPPIKWKPKAPQLLFNRILSTNTKSYTCNICSRTFRSQSGFAVHKNWHEKLERNVQVEYTCEYCDRPPFTSYREFKEHFDGHSTHFKRQHKLKEKVVALKQVAGVDFCNLPTGPICGQCKKKFPDFKALNQHRRINRHEISKIYNTKQK